MTEANQKRITDLIDRLNAGTVTDEEKQELHQWLGSIDFADIPLLDESSKDFKERLHHGYAAVVARARIIQRRKKRLRMGWQVAAAVTLIIGTGLLWKFNSSKTVVVPHVAVPNDMPPGSTKARLVLANGKSVQLHKNADSAFSQGRVQVQQANGRVTYQSVGRGMEPAYNTLITPHGGQYQLTLSDGTKIWLNAASSLKYPIQFNGKERVVALTGEAYFEIAQNAAKPFIVRANNLNIKVLGTSFNVSAYTDDPRQKTVLVEGAIKVEKGRKSKILKPGQQAVTERNNDDIRLSDADIEEAIAWKNGLFHFDGEDMTTIMHKIARWYDIKVVYEGDIPQRHYSGVISRDINLSKVLEVLKLSGINFKINKDSLIVIN